VNAMSLRHAGSGHSGNSRNSRKPSHSDGCASSKQHVKLIKNCQRCKTSDPIRQCPASNKFCAACGRPNVTVHAVEQQAHHQEQSPGVQFLVTDNDAIGLAQSDPIDRPYDSL
jgi:hypothetical protein